MNNDIEMQINIKEVIWDLLEQWKVVLIVALITAILVPGAKYFKDLKGYEAAIAIEKEQEESNYATLDEELNAIFEGVPIEDQEMVKLVMQQEAWLDNQREYFNNSLLLTMDPNAQRQLSLSYYVYDAEDNAYSAINSSYRNHLKEADFVKAVKEQLDTDVEEKYIKELISGSYTSTASEGTAGEILTVSLILPETADADKLEKEITGLLTKFSKELSEKITPHKIKFIESNDTIAVNESAANKRTNTINSINSLNNIIKSNKSALSEDQKRIYERVEEARERHKMSKELESAPQNDNVIEGPVKPSISKKYIALGFILGVMAYAFVYLLRLILLGRINYASDVESYTGNRLLGEVYRKSEQKGLKSLLSSKIVDKYRYKGLMDEAMQIDKMLSSIEASCEHAKADKVTLFTLGNVGDIAKSTASMLEKNGIGTETVAISDNTREKDLLSKDNAVCIVEKGTKISDLGRLWALLTDYDIKTLGSVSVADI